MLFLPLICNNSNDFELIKKDKSIKKGTVVIALCDPEKSYDLDKIRSLSFENMIRIILGPIKKDGDDQYQTYLIDERGLQVNIYKQLHSLEKNITNQLSFRNSLFSIDGKILGIMTEEDLLFPEYARSLALADVDSIIYLSYKDQKIKNKRSIVQARAAENMTPILSLIYDEDFFWSDNSGNINYNLSKFGGWTKKGDRENIFSMRRTELYRFLDISREPIKP